MDLTKKISKLQEEVLELGSRIDSNDRDIFQKKELISTLEAKLKELRLQSALDPSEQFKNEIEDIRGKLSTAKNDFEEHTILAEALEKKKSQVAAEIKGLKSDRGRAEGLKMVKQLPGLIEEYNSLANRIIYISAAAKFILAEAKDRNCKSEVDPSFWAMVNAMVGMVPKAEIKGNAPILATINNFNKQELLKELLS